MGLHVTWQDVPGFTEDDDWRVSDAEALARLASPCTAALLSDGREDVVVAILRKALMRWKEQGTGARTTLSQGAGPWQRTETTDNRSWHASEGGIFLAQELEQLRQLCSAGASANAGTASTLPAGYGTTHSVTCSLAFGALYCSCGADIAGFPIHEGVVW